MCKINNKGSATVEMSFIMPMVIVVVSLIIMIFVSELNDGITQGVIYENLYQYNRNLDEKILKENISNDINDVYVGSVDLLISEYRNNGNITVDIDKKKYIYSTEYNKCSQRLRRWQLYGNILQD